MKLRIATCAELPEVDVDEAPLREALARAGFDATWVAWDDPSADWDAPIPTVIRSTWNYALDVERFLAWVERASRAAPLWNPPDVVRENVFKRYLLALAARGVPVVPTTLVERGRPVPALPDGKIVVKPEVGAGSLGARVFARADGDAHRHIDELLVRSPVLVQPYVPSVEAYGERSMIWIDGEVTHAIRKSPRFSGDSESVTGPHPIAPEEREVALAAIAPYANRICYGRVDLARDERGQPMVMELELVEPSLFFSKHPPALARYIAALRRLTASR